MVFVCVVPTNGYILLHLHLNKTPILKVVLSFYSLKTKPGVHVKFSYHVLCLTPPKTRLILLKTSHVRNISIITHGSPCRHWSTSWWRCPTSTPCEYPVEGRGDVPAPSKRCQWNPKGSWIGTIWHLKVLVQKIFFGKCLTMPETYMIIIISIGMTIPVNDTCGVTIVFVPK